MYYPTLKEVRRLKKYGNLVPVCRDIQADPETPVSAYLKIARGSYSFLLGSLLLTRRRLTSMFFRVHLRPESIMSEVEKDLLKNSPKQGAQ
jgi:hypothetical protein